MDCALADGREVSAGGEAEGGIKQSFGQKRQC